MRKCRIVIVLGLLLLLTQCNDDLEKPAYQVIKQEGDMELRVYASMPLVTASMENGNSNKAFRQLFKYIDRGNAADQKIAMTAPVIMSSMQDKSQKIGEMSFVVPAEVAQVGAPAPKSSQVQLTQMQAGKVAVIRFYKYDDAPTIKEATVQLKAWIKQQGLQAVSETKLAYYDPPWTPEKYRTNEIWIAVK